VICGFIAAKLVLLITAYILLLLALFHSVTFAAPVH
jgi:hypothetical protein